MAAATSTDWYQRWGKRTLDLAIVIPALMLLLPVYLTVACLVRWKLGSPVHFRQRRPGLHGNVFEMLKFRSMTNARDADGALLPDADRLPPFGQWLRSSSLDELPELINILRGEMSLVGPRPLLVEYLDHYSPEQARRHDVRPGLTGWAQVNGRNTLPWEERFALDVWYVDHCSLRTDLRVLWMTVFKVLKRDGISAEGHATMPPFHLSRQTSTGDRADRQRAA